MKNTNNRICICCGKEFYFCPKCGNSSKNTGVSMNFDTKECKELVNVLSGYSMNIYDKNVIKSVLDKYGITDYTKYKQSIQDKLNELFSVNKNEIIKESLVVEESTKSETIEEVNNTDETNETEIADEQKEDDTPNEYKAHRKHRSHRKNVVLSDETDNFQSDNGDNL